MYTRMIKRVDQRVSTLEKNIDATVCGDLIHYLVIDARFDKLEEIFSIDESSQ